MSKKSDKAAAALAARETEDRMALFAFDQRMDRQAEQDRQRNREFLLAAKQELDRDEAEAESVEVENYRLQAVAQATSSKSIAPQFVAFITGTSKQEIDARIEQAKAATAEIVSELAGQGEPSVQSRDEYTGQFIPQQPQVADRYLPQGMTAAEYAAAADGTLDMGTYTRMRDRIRSVNDRDRGIFS